MIVVTFNSIPNNVTFAKAFQYTDSSNNPIDLTGSTLNMQARPTATSNRAVPVLVTVTDAPNGKFTVSIAPGALTSAQPGTYVHDLVRLRPDGLTEQIWSGTMVIAEGVTR